MKYRNFVFYSRNDKSITIEHTKRVYGITESGNFKRKPETEYTEIVSGEFYENFIRSIDFFNGFMGGKCRAERNYTVVGYLPTKVITTSPNRAEKHIDTFTFKY